MAKRFSTLGRYPTTRLRRNRREAWSRRLVAEHKLSVDDLIWPVFVQEGKSARTPVESMPGVDRLSVRPAGRGGQTGARSRHPRSGAVSRDRSQEQDPRRPRGLQPRQPRLPRHHGGEEAVPDIGVVCDVALDPFNSDGHDGIVRDGYVQNDETLEALIKQAIVQTEAAPTSRPRPT